METLPAPPASPLIYPTIYGRDEMPLTDQRLTGQHEPQALQLRSGRDIVLFKKNVAVSTQTSEVLSASFLRKRSYHHGGVRHNVDTDSYDLKSPSALTIHTRCQTPIYFADTDQPDIYGHVLLEALPRLWALDRVHPRMPVVTSVMPHRSYDLMFEALGVPADRLIRINHPVVADKVYFPDLPVVRRSWVHPSAFDVFAKLGQLADRSTLDAPERIYISRSRVAGRPLTNESEVEAYFLSKGFVVVHPQEHPIEDQIKLFGRARMVAAAGGSATHNFVFSPAETKMLIICSEGWMVNADMLLSQHPGRLGYVFGQASMATAASHRSGGPWQVDMSDVRAAAEEHFGL
ncbi:DUF563 domain-containing protein [Roseomonas sp. 18066]|uniref:glycosyltransferase family 61 protein n=1 Tax=Roseomonas sp. 18066 TaxID=2681412 RepID=UPI00135A391B|nr:glycosyltransferase 61 family protein [Roseomonas sp. 18066]